MAEIKNYTLNLLPAARVRTLRLRKLAATEIERGRGFDEIRRRG